MSLALKECTPKIEVPKLVVLKTTKPQISGSKALENLSCLPKACAPFLVVEFFPLPAAQYSF